ncbi:MAG: FeoB-associated Cys-rich membrane protein [Oscillospiraceae bacterium]|nr:FeoB-associated Cys-rich membrane protein [Oscillospiraceae bacterium]MBR2640102.1 FeoB-associated Cys-rich membrane protein [Oscillospiraceae bacterium]
MENIIIIVILAVIVGLAGWYIYKAKKSGKKCIGCPEGCSCSAKNTGCACSCCEHREK